MFLPESYSSNENQQGHQNRTPKLPSCTGEEVSLKSEDNGANNPNTEATKFTRIFRVLENLMTNHFSFSANSFKPTLLRYNSCTKEFTRLSKQVGGP